MIFLTFCKLRDSVGAAFPKVIAQPVIVTCFLMILLIWDFIFMLSDFQIFDEIFSFGMSFSCQIGESMGREGFQTLSPGYEKTE